MTFAAIALPESNADLYPVHADVCDWEDELTEEELELASLHDAHYSQWYLTGRNSLHNYHVREWLVHGIDLGDVPF
jgi:hypothetical protein